MPITTYYSPLDDVDDSPEEVVEDVPHEINSIPVTPLTPQSAPGGLPSFFGARSKSKEEIEAEERYMDEEI